MSKPEDIPQDVWDVAVRCAGWGGGHEMQGVIQAQREGIARAIMAEREACAQVAESEANDWDDLHMHEASACLFVATAIRNRSGA